MKNNFPQKARDLFDKGGYMNSWDNHGTSDADCLHHILGRCSNSIYNAAPLNNFRDHMPEGRNAQGYPSLSSPLVISRYLKKTKKYLDSIEYIPNENDKEFLKKYTKYYK